MALHRMLQPGNAPLLRYSDHAEDRVMLGRQLATLLQPYRTSRALVLGLPADGVAVALGVAQALRLPLDVLIAREFVLPPYMAMQAGALSEGGGLCLNASVLRQPGVRLSTMWSEIMQTHHELEQLEATYRDGAPLSPVERRMVILVDDGISDGLLQLAALATLHRAHVRQCIVATPGGTKAALQRVRAATDLLISAQYIPTPGIGQRKLSDDEAATLLHTYQQLAR
jgi:putative phosphoribosyl transferase